MSKLNKRHLRTRAMEDKTYAMRQRGMSFVEIAKYLGVSERMVYRYLDAYLLRAYTAKVEITNQVLGTLRQTHPEAVGEFIKLFKQLESERK